MSGTTSGVTPNKLKLLVPTSFSRRSELALDFALSYSQNFNADVYLFHVLEDSTKNFRRLDALTQEHMERMRQVVVNAVERMHGRGLTHHLEDVHRRVSGGKPWLEILRMAAGVSCDMIIMGAPNTDEFKKLLRQAPCTTVLVREKDTSFVV